MKKVYFLFIVSILAFGALNAQIMKASIGTGSTATRFKIYLQGDASSAASNISTLQFNLGVSDATVPKPTMTVVSTTLAGVTWSVSEETLGGFYNFQVTTAASPINTAVTANTEFEVMEVEFAGGPAGLSPCLVTLPDGGAGNANSLYLCTGGYSSDGSNLYYSRVGTTVNNQMSYDQVNGVPGVATSTACLGSAVTPMFFRTVQSGNWNNTATWESSPDNITYTAATSTPTSADMAIVVRNGHTVTVTAAVTIDETTVQPQGAIIANDALTVQNQGLSFESDGANTGMLGNSSGTVTGDVNVDRFIPARRAWRFMAPSVNATETINAAWQEGAGGNAASDPKPGYGTHITGGSVANGFDQRTVPPTSNSSLKLFDGAANTFSGIASTNVPLNSNPAYFLFVRGNRLINLDAPSTSLPAASTTTLTSTGAVRTGLQSVPVNATGFTLVANPYISPIDFALVTKTSVTDRFFVWDPKRGTVGSWVFFDGPGYVPLATGGSYNGPNSLIQTGQAFLVEGSGAGASLGINEDDKSVTQGNVFRGAKDKDQKLQVNMHFFDESNNAILTDATLARFNGGYSANVNGEDVGKPVNVDENIAIERNGHLMTVERRPLVQNGEEVVYLNMFNMKTRDYQFEVIPTDFSTPGLTATIEDAYLKTSTPLSLTSPTVIKFSVTAGTASADAKRFKITFRSVPVAEMAEGISVYPNPAKGGFTFSMKKADVTGKVRLSLVSKSGQTVAVKEISSEQAAKYYFGFPKAGLSAGTYILNVYNGDKYVESKQIVIER